MLQSVQVALTPIVCGKCGAAFAMATAFYEQCRDMGDKFYCPLGHCRAFRGSDVARLTRELAKKDQELARKQETIESQQKTTERVSRMVRAQKGIVTRLKKKVALGTCPCCDKLFPDLSSHMAAEHPDFEGKAEAEEADEAAS